MSFHEAGAGAGLHLCREFPPCCGGYIGPAQGRRHDLGRGHQCPAAETRFISTASENMLVAEASNLRKGACLEKNWPFELSRVNDQPSRACFDEAVAASGDLRCI